MLALGMLILLAVTATSCFAASSVLSPPKTTAHGPVAVDSRADWGAGKAVAIYLLIGVLWGLGMPPARLKRLYEDIR